LTSASDETPEAVVPKLSVAFITRQALRRRRPERLGQVVAGAPAGRRVDADGWQAPDATAC
jgi:hypothetical protein